MTFQSDSGVTPDPGTSQVSGKLVGSRALSNTNPGSLKPDSRDPETETGSLVTEKRVHRTHDTLETGLQIMLRSLVAPSRGAGGFKCGRVYLDLKIIRNYSRAQRFDQESTMLIFRLFY